jgi:CheY-like chemotaxis protein
VGFAILIRHLHYHPSGAFCQTERTRIWGRRIGSSTKDATFKFLLISNKASSATFDEVLAMPKKQANHKPTVLSVGAYPELLSLRAAVLSNAGYAVFTTTDPHEADSRIKKGDCAVLLLCYSIAQNRRKQIVESFRKHCPEGRIVSITNEVESDANHTDADNLVFGIEGAEALLAAIEQAVRPLSSSVDSL